MAFTAVPSSVMVHLLEGPGPGCIAFWGVSVPTESLFAKKKKKKKKEKHGVRQHVDVNRQLLFNVVAGSKRNGGCSGVVGDWV